MENPHHRRASSADGFRVTLNFEIVLRVSQLCSAFQIHARNNREEKCDVTRYHGSKISGSQQKGDFCNGEQQKSNRFR